MTADPCAVTGCDRPIAARGWCRPHYLRWHRDGDVRADVPLIERRPKGRPGRRSDGYVTLHMPGHPLASPSGQVLAHRLGAWMIFGQGPFRCDWCGCPVSWFGDDGERLVVDHLNGDRGHNHPTNLAISCRGCNAIREAHPAAFERRRGRCGRPALL